MASVDDWKGILDKYELQLKSSAKGVGIQFGLMSAVSLATFLCFSFFRPRMSKVYAPKIKYRDSYPPTEDIQDIQDPGSEHLADKGYDPRQLPELKDTFFGWVGPVYRATEDQMMANMGLDAATFLRFVRMMLHIFYCVSVFSFVLMILYIVYNVKKVAADKRADILSMLTIANVQGSWMWAALAMTYLINFVVMGFVWFNWQKMVQLRHRWFRSRGYQDKIYSRTLMVTHVPKSYRNDEGLVHLITQLKVDGIKIRQEIEGTSIGRRLGDFPDLVDQHNEAVRDLERTLVKYLKHDTPGKPPKARIGGHFGIGGRKVDAIDYYAKQIKFLRDQIDTRRKAIDSLVRNQRKARKGFGGSRPGPAQYIEGENYGFITFKTIAEAHRIARTHQGKLAELDGASLQLAPLPQDIVWKNIAKDSAELASTRTWGFVLIGLVCFFNTVPLTGVALLANLASLSDVVPFIASWQAKYPWLLSIVSGVLPSIVQGLFGYFLPYLIRRISKYQGAQTRSRLERAVIARYFFFMIVSSFIILILLSVFFNLILGLVKQISSHASAGSILKNLSDLPGQIQSAYVSMSNYWLSWLPLRGFLLFFELIQLIKLALVGVRRFMFSYTPRDIRDITKPPAFEYAIVIVNLLFLATVGLAYAVLAPLVAIGTMFAIGFSLMVYKYQLLFVYITKAESGGRMWNVYVNRLFISCILMQLLMVLTTALVRKKWLDSIAAVPPILMIIGFKFYLGRTCEYNFRYYRPSPQEVDEERRRVVNEKPIKHSEVERRFIHPALLNNKLFHVEVHKKQKAAAREVLSQYEWMRGKEVKGVDEQNLSYDALRDGPVDSSHRNDIDNRSIASTSALSKLDMMSDTSGYNTPALYNTLAQSNPGSTDNLLLHASGPARGGLYPTQSRTSDEGKLPLIDPFNQSSSGGVPYPPSAFAGRPPLYRNHTSSSSLEQAPLVRYTSQDSFGGSTHRVQNSNGSGQDMYATRSRQGSIGDGLDQFGRPTQRSRQGSIGDGLDQYGRTRSRQGSVGDGLNQFNQPRSRQGSVGDGLNPYSQPTQRSRQGSFGDGLNQFAPPGQRSRQGSFGDGLNQFTPPGQRSRQGSVGDGLNPYNQPQRPRQGSIGDALDQNGRPRQGNMPRQGSAGSNLNLYGSQPSSGRGSPQGAPYPPYGGRY